MCCGSDLGGLMCTVKHIGHSSLHVTKKGKRNLWHAALFALWQWLASVPQYLLSDFLLSSRGGGGKEPPSMKLTKIALSCFAHFYIYSSANTTQNQFTYFDGLPLKQVFCINSIVHSSCESTFHVWQYSFWWWSECFTIKLNHFLGQSLSQT